MKKTTLTQISIKDLLGCRELILANNVPVWRQNKKREMVIIPLQKIEQYASNNTSELKLFVEGNWRNRIIKEKNQGAATVHPDRSQSSLDEVEVTQDSFVQKLDAVKSLTFNEREQLFSDNIERLDDRLKNNKKITDEVVEDLYDVTSDAMAINKTFMEENIDDSIELPLVHVEQIATKSNHLVHSVVSMVRGNEMAANYLDMLSDLSKGSTLDHMNNVFLRFVPFLLFYNSFITSGRIAHLRAMFNKRFSDFYQSFLGEISSFSFELIFRGGIRSVDNISIHNYSLGSMMHDIGKIRDIDYFEGDADYNREIIVKHAPMSYNLIAKTRQMPTEVALMAALHHEYYGHSSGYNVGKLLFPEKNRRYKLPEGVISYDYADLATGRSLAFFPAKLLEIIDVYDALIDPSRKYRKKNNTPEEALNIMQEQFVNKDHKLDPVLMTIFVEFVIVHSELADLSEIAHLRIK